MCRIDEQVSASIWVFLDWNLLDFPKNAWLKSYGVHVFANLNDCCELSTRVHGMMYMYMYLQKETGSGDR